MHLDPGVRGRLSGGSDDLQVLATGQEGMEARLLDDRADTGEASARRSGTGNPRSCMVPLLARVSPSSILISVVLPAPFGPR